MVLWTIAIFMTIVFLAMLLLVLFRKIQFDAVHRNFLDFEDEFGGNIDRRGFAVRPKYNGIYKGQPFAISFTSEKDQQIRRYYIVITMKGHSQKNFTIMSREWLGNGKMDEERQRDALPINNDRYLLESPNVKIIKKLDVSAIENIIETMEPFAWMLVGKSQMLLERASQNIVEDTKIEALRPLLEGLFRLQETTG
ncbi:MAG: hypothetical protein R3C41_05825 [Calditrichia bacterium]|nr:hypothetical protein [Calditrichota bacterium]MCB0266985.1 hypothetical protein [Calditrichota bacterium]MCB0288466.1 hypothetical protein [Calditrichota bacterium]MCB9069964.1 hypothetical protein [Calditrichia bacterium]